jgi:hypothetical protein
MTPGVSGAGRYAVGWSMMQQNCAAVAAGVNEISISTAAALGIERKDVGEI